MAITYPLTSLPAAWRVARLRWTGRSNVAVPRSVFSFAAQAQDWGGQMWLADVDFPPLGRAEAQGLVAWIRSLNGAYGTFLMGDPSRAAPLGSAAATPGTPVVDGAGQTGQDLAIRGAPASATGYLLAGDLVQIDTGADARLHEVLADVDTDGSGDATLTLWPSLRVSPADGTALAVTACVGVFRAVNNDIFTDVAPGDDWRPPALQVAEALEI